MLHIYYATVVAQDIGCTEGVIILLFDLSFVLAEVTNIHWE